ncbi:MAG TPA: DUF5995 family protein [Terriglobia bacterium]|nr:DUF5995 family protein [Terriglobia bacterium]
MNGSTTDRQLLQILKAPAPTDIAGVVARMLAIDNLLGSSDGLKWFNLLYLNVTQKVDTQPPPGGWKSPLWLTRLDVVFAGMYFTAVEDWLEGSAKVPSSWKALFEARFTTGIERIQFALAGMNAHINHDLALALLQTDSEMNLVPAKNSAEHDDYEQVNGILEAVLPLDLQYLATGILGELAQDTGKIGRLLAIWNVRAARDLAWDFADHLRSLDGVARTVALAAQDQVTGALGRSLLIRV